MIKVGSRVRLVSDNTGYVGESFNIGCVGTVTEVVPHPEDSSNLAAEIKMDGWVGESLFFFPWEFELVEE